MIKNDRQLAITKNRLDEFQKAYAQVSEERLIIPIIKKAQLDALKSQIQIFENEIKEYELLKSGKISCVSITSVKSIPEGLIKTRIARGWSQARLAEKIGVKEQQVQRDEASNYERANLARLAEIAAILELDFHGSFKDITEPENLFSPAVLAIAGKVEQKVHQSKRLLAI